MRVLVCGGRDFADRDRAFQVLDHYSLLAHGFSLVIHGAASGADSLAGEWATARGVEPAAYPAAWTDLTAQPLVLRYRRDGTAYNAAAGGIRNRRMLVEGKPDLVIAFHGGKGTADMRKQAMDWLGEQYVLVIP